MSSGKAFPPRCWVHRDSWKSDAKYFFTSMREKCDGDEYLSLEEHSALLAEKDKEIAKLKWQLSQFKVIGTDQCQSCEGGRVSLFMANQECISCNPTSYDTYEQREALAGGEGRK